MTNERLIQYGHVWALAVFLSFAVVAVAQQSEAPTQNSNQKTTNPKSQNKNANRNSNTGDMVATGESMAAKSLRTQDKNFLMEAAMGGMMEVELGKIAAQKGSSDAVKQFGQRMVDDHSKVDSELAQLAGSKGLTLPTELDDKHRTAVTKFSSLSGAAFDRAYSKDMLSDHTKDVAAFQRASKTSTDPEVKAFAAKTLPTLQEHLTLAKTLNTKMPGGTTKNSNRP